MVEPFSLAAIGALAATEGIKFLYGQATEVLKRWRDRKAGKETEAQEPIRVEAADVADVLEGTLQPPKVDFEALDRFHDDIQQLARVLGNYAGGLDQPDPNDRELAATADGLRRALEAVYGQRITFKGENRQPSGPMVIGSAEADKVAGDLAGVRARLVRSGRIEGTVRVKEVAKGGKATGTEVDTVE
jgi:hypothetical protein